MNSLQPVEVNCKCVEAGKQWEEYIIRLSTGLLMQNSEIKTVCVSFDVFLSLLHHTVSNRSGGGICRLYEGNCAPAAFETLAFAEKYFFFTPFEKLELIIDFFAEKESVGFVS